MASKKMADEYVSALGDYYKVYLAKFFSKYGGEGSFLSNLMVYKQNYDFECDTSLAEAAMKKYDKNFGEKHGVELIRVLFDSNLKPIYCLSIFPGIFAEYDYDVPFSIAVGESIELDKDAYKFIVKKIDEEKLSNEIKRLQLEVWKA